MAKKRHLKNAPITEAVIDFRAKLEDNFDPKRFLAAKERFGERFPEVSEQVTKQITFNLEGSGKIMQSVDDIGYAGYRFFSKDRKNIAHFTKKGFSFSRLHPYTDWEKFSNEAFDLWKIYSEISTPFQTIRLATRFINRIEIPIPFNDFAEYLNYPPSIPDCAPKTVSSFLTRTVVRDLKKGFSANLILALNENEVTSEIIPVILDTDVYTDQGLEKLDENVIREIFTLFRDFKNDIFFSSITEKTATLFE